MKKLSNMRRIEQWVCLKKMEEYLIQELTDEHLLEVREINALVDLGKGDVPYRSQILEYSGVLVGFN